MPHGFIVIAGILVAFATWCAWCVTVYRFVLFKQYSAYSQAAREEGRPYNWVRFIHVFHWNMLLAGPSQRMNPVEWLAIMTYCLVPPFIFLGIFLF